jgi:hypothetical protein
MLQIVLGTISFWLWALLPIGLPAVLMLGLWKMWSYQGDFALNRHEKILRIALFACAIFVICWILAWSTARPRNQQIGWDSVAD